MSLLDWNSIENSRHGIIESIKCTTENLPPQWSSFGLTCLPVLIPCLEFTIEIKGNLLVNQ